MFRRHAHWARVGAIGVAVVLLAAACGSSRNDSSGGGGGSGTTVAGGVNVSTADCTDYQPTQGVTNDSITFGSSFPKSGLYAAYAEISKGYLAYFAYVNAQGGVKGHQIKVITKDDQYDSGKTRTNTQELTQQDGVFAMFNVVGTPNNLAIRDDLADGVHPGPLRGDGLAPVG